MSGVADVLADLLADVRVSVSAYDGSAAGSPDPVVRAHIAAPSALGHLVQAPGALGLARAYISGGLDLRGADGGHVDHHALLAELAGPAADAIAVLSWKERLALLRRLGPGVLRPVPPPPQEVRPGMLWGLRHSLRRDAKAISHHYDVSNQFYRWVLGPSMAYTCAVFDSPDTSLEAAQEEKVDLVCRKLDLRPGQRLLDVGCGWGLMVRHAAKHYGVHALGVTLSRQQAEWAGKAIADEGLSERAEVRHADYRSVAETGFDAVSSIGLTEHIGRRSLPGYAAFLRSKLRPQGRLLNHCITRPTSSAPGIRRTGFINRYVFPDGELESAGAIITVLQDAGLEVHHEENLREHYALTLDAWCANLDAHWDEAVAEVGLETAKVWAVYMAGSQLSFELGQIELHQVLATRSEGGNSGMPLRPDFTRSRPPL